MILEVELDRWKCAHLLGYPYTRRIGACRSPLLLEWHNKPVQAFSLCSYSEECERKFENVYYRAGVTINRD